MVEADRHSMGPGARGKGDGTMTEPPEGVPGENAVPSDRDKSRHADARGLDGRSVQTEPYRDHVGARRADTGADSDAANAGGTSGPVTDGSGEESRLRRQGG